MRLINADKLRDEWLYGSINEPIYEPNDVLESIDDQPTADAEITRHGYWKKVGDKRNSYDYICSECCRSVTVADPSHLLISYPYCHCGAKMSMEEEE